MNSAPGITWIYVSSSRTSGTMEQYPELHHLYSSNFFALFLYAQFVMENKSGWADHTSALVSFNQQKWMENSGKQAKEKKTLLWPEQNYTWLIGHWVHTENKLYIK